MNPTPYDQIGGDDGVRALVDRFYGHMDTLPAAKEVRAMHPKNLDSSIEKLYEFLSGWLGGPQLYMQKRGHPRLRRRHMPFSINTEGARQWMMCMERALADADLSEPTRAMLLQRFEQVANFMRNQPDERPA
ncbi:MAG: group II truncated hemoglobin [Myxococcales bacterium]|nr:group II truncated hemoglobin [Myxococcales bacterium]